MRTSIVGSSFLVLLSLFSCAIAPKEEPGPAQNREIANTTTEFYQGDVLRTRGKESVSSPMLLKLKTTPSENQIQVELSYRPLGKREMELMIFDLQRIGTTDVFLITERRAALEGRVRFSGGSEWRWDAWSIGLTTPDGTAIAGAMAREPSTGDFRLRIEATNPAGKRVESASAQLRFVTEEDFEAMSQALAP